MAQLTPIRGFVNTPASRSICIVTTVAAVMISILQWKNYFRLILDPYLVDYNQYWRIAIYQLVLINESDYMLLLLLWFHYKTLERFYGTSRYISLIIIFALYNSLICIISMCLLQTVSYTLVFLAKTILFKQNEEPFYKITIFNEIIPGPLGIISSLYIAYGNVIPVTYYAKILISNPFKTAASENDSDIESSNKVLTLSSHFQIHIIYTLLLLNNGFKSIIPCLIGILIGKLYVHELLPGSKTWILHPTLVSLIASPRRCLQSIDQRIRSRLSGGYSPVETSANNGSGSFMADDAEEVDNEHNEDNRIRAETPVRPLGSQFLDTFRV